MSESSNEILPKWAIFDGAFYLAQLAHASPEIDKDNDDGLWLHYCTIGWRNGIDPSPYFQLSWYKSQFEGIALENMDPTEHYRRVGWRAGFRPNKYFQTDWYLAKYSDVDSAGIDPLEHYINFGRHESRKPCPYFDQDWYRNVYADVANSGIEPLRHYLHFGAAEHRNPNHMFDSKWYYENYKRDVANIDPLFHYITNGWKSGFAPSKNFDPVFYRKNNPLLRDDQDPLYHYLEYYKNREHACTNTALDQQADAQIRWLKVNAPISTRTDKSTLIYSDLLDIDDRILRAVPSLKAISFDVFDTLIERRCGRPENVFALAALQAGVSQCDVEEVVRTRIDAELISRKNAKSREITIHEIYDNFAQLSKKYQHNAQAMMDAELQIEQNVCVPKESGVKLYQSLLKLGINIYLVSDIYLPVSTMVSIVDKCGITDYAGMFVSSQIGATKHFGHMFEYLSNSIKVGKSHILHIGDNSLSDFRVPADRGLHACLVEKSASIVNTVTTSQWQETPYTVDGLFLSICAGEAIHSRANAILKRQTQQRSSNELESAGYSCLGPLLLSFTQYLIGVARIQGLSTLYFVSRDGFYMKEAYDIFKMRDPDLPGSKYLLGSRRVLRAIDIVNRSDVDKISSIDHKPMTMEEILTSRFQINMKDIQSVSRELLANGLEDLSFIVEHNTRDPRYSKVIDILLPTILHKCSSLRQIYKEYISDIGLTEGYNGVIDIGYRGTIQKSLLESCSINCHGIYFSTWPEADNLLNSGLRFDSFIRCGSDPNHPLIKYVQLFELFFSATHGTLISFDRQGIQKIPVLEAAPFGNQSREALNYVHKGAIDFIREWLSVYGPDLELSSDSRERCYEAMVELFESPPRSIASAFEGEIFEDKFGGDKRFIAVGRTGNNQLKSAIENSSWKSASSVLWQTKTTLEGKSLMTVTQELIEDSFSGTNTIPSYKHGT
ncbi:hypothetical protein GCM10007887_36760 [Methylobacterium haplocladii]|uniref:Haloacid dehalogenase n=2 Tax=Methylobacterium haplocladii TaxID=1176176 RepID=A0A512IVS1_9HYPH|nr:hypothetical protein MHA02_42110 [Methylobacterium haplocladii]GJD86481.1 hypothetical protein HPGCJGGD_4388 [Methylobacterium haplocladii]GLS60984.1 hypothetical protein GCM10007887_36760 [Methylobacterium haplocladii]